VFRVARTLSGICGVVWGIVVCLCDRCTFDISGQFGVSLITRATDRGIRGGSFGPRAGLVGWY